MFALLPATAAAGGAFFFKSGALRLQDDRQTIDAVARNLDEASYKTFGIGWEARRKNGLAFSIEYLDYRNEFTPPVSPTSGEARARTLQFGAKKYFIEGGPFHPYFGAGIGVGRTNVDYPSGSLSITEEDVAIVLHAALGMELRVDNVSFMLEAKYNYFDVEGQNSQYDPTSVGMLLGVGFNW
jgi:opacity protein-like surface antigen